MRICEKKYKYDKWQHEQRQQSRAFVVDLLFRISARNVEKHKHACSNR